MGQHYLKEEWKTKLKITTELLYKIGIPQLEQVSENQYRLELKVKS